MDQLLGLGDIHGKINILVSEINRIDLENTFIIQVGDFGIGFYNIAKEARRLKYLDDFLKRRNITLYAIRGNHDDPRFFRDTWQEEVYNFNVEVKKYTNEIVDQAIKDIGSLTNIIFLPDYSVIELLGKRILCVGGAISIDRSKRKQDYDWWKDEVLVLDQIKLDNIGSVDFLCMHLLPASIMGQLKYKIGEHPDMAELIKVDTNLKSDLSVESHIAELIYQRINNINVIQRFFCGHYHRTVDHRMFETRINVIDVDEFISLI